MDPRSTKDAPAMKSMHLRLALAGLVTALVAMASGSGCSAKQPVNGCFVQGTPEFGNVDVNGVAQPGLGPVFFAKYTLQSTSDSTGANGCAFLGTYKDSAGNPVAVESLGTTEYGYDNSNFTVGIRPAMLDGTGPAGVAVGAFNNDPNVCSAATFAAAVGVVVDPNLNAVSLPDGGTQTLAPQLHRHHFPGKLLADGGGSSSASSGSTGSTSSSDSSSSSGGSSDSTSSSGSSGPAASTGGSSGATSSSTGGSSGSGAGAAICSACLLPTDCASGSCNTNASAPGAPGYCDTASGTCAQASDCGGFTCDAASSACYCGLPRVQVSYSFSQVHFEQAANIGGKQLSANLVISATPVDPGASTCTANIRVDAVWYNASEDSDGGLDLEGNYCDPTVANNCDRYSLHLPEPATGPGGWECAPMISSDAYPGDLPDAGATGIGLPFVCVPAGKVPVNPAG